MEHLFAVKELIIDILKFGKELFFDSSDEEAEEVEKIWNFAEYTVACFSDQQFKFHFRMSATSASAAEILLIKLHSVADNSVTKGHPKLTLEKQLLITLWYLSNIESFRQVALKFGITKSTCWDVLYRICKKLLLVNQKFGIIQWPSVQRGREIIRNFQEISSFPGVIGAIDGCHIEITMPQDHRNSYINRKGYASVILQAVCDHRKLFTDVFVGIPGSVHDARVFQMSDLNERILAEQVLFPDNSYMIGDLAYVLSETLMVGFKANRELNNLQKNFNTKLSKARITIEHAFAWLKGKFRRLKLLETNKGDAFDEVIDIVHAIDGNQYVEQEVNGQNINARAKRLDIMYNLPQDD